ncbi:hypothetical protein CHL76_15900, partial [Marinococcus halophilus]|uniref:hypothetical protein n=1 Tax=Marinococcus halophilus TaxID=1371 RepID=UPI000BCA54A2
ACLCGDEPQKTRHLAVATDVRRPLDASFSLNSTNKGLRNSFSEAFVYNLKQGSCTEPCFTIEFTVVILAQSL